MFVWVCIYLPCRYYLNNKIDYSIAMNIYVVKYETGGLNYLDKIAGNDESPTLTF